MRLQRLREPPGPPAQEDQRMVLDFGPSEIAARHRPSAQRLERVWRVSFDRIYRNLMII